MDIAEQAAKAQKEEDIDVNFQFYNAKNLTNSAPNISGSDENEVCTLYPIILRHSGNNKLFPVK